MTLLAAITLPSLLEQRIAINTMIIINPFNLKQMKKNIFAFTAAAVIAAATLTSCATISTGAALAESAMGQKVGEAKSTVILGLWSSKGEQNNLRQAARNGGISKVSQVEYVNQSILFGLLINRTTRVYGE